jgi:8-oxo-dGTP pyrophosphatase MutT (NUDIX family)
MTERKLDPSQRRAPGAPLPKLIDAATILLIKREASGPTVLMGHRSSAHKFMPNTFVFPGGRVDPNDHTPPTADNLHPATLHRLTRRRRVSVRRAKALALAAIRETFEETGLILGRLHGGAIDPAPIAEDWRPFFEAGYVPTPAALDYIFRAVTPPNNFRRFDARFFLADANTVHGEIGGTGELVDLQWIPIPDAMGMPKTPSPTRGALQTALDLVQSGATLPQPMNTPVPALITRYGNEAIEYD